MKNIVVRAVLGLALLFALGTVFSVPAYAATSQTASSRFVATSRIAAIPPIQRDDCIKATASAIFITVRTDNGANTDCFDGLGTLNVTLYNADQVCTGINERNNIVWEDDGWNYVQLDMGHGGCWWLNGPNTTVNRVTSITISL